MGAEADRASSIDEEAAALWDFAVRVYDMAGIKDACLAVQARYGLSISTLLGAIWAGAHGHGRLGATQLETTVRRAIEWHREVIEPMRALRRRLRQQPPPGLEARTEALRREVLRQELEAERIEQHLFLEDFPRGECAVSPAEERWRDATANAALYTRKSCPRPEAEALDALALILGAAFPDVDAAAIKREAAGIWRVGG
ncbi:TIGR02444 family protein [Arhodomonas sp. SL1]|uniref:TIGR02444 family protein n=1 Tax=Arhodomonas sp. SL1 TaxID=3425691 RepID=UPI003F880E34